ncbi:ribonuclease H-like domain-containing protein [Tanacetum coccineum]
MEEETEGLVFGTGSTTELQWVSRTGVVMVSGPTGGWTGGAVLVKEGCHMVLVSPRVQGLGAGAEAWFICLRAMLTISLSYMATSVETAWVESRTYHWAITASTRYRMYQVDAHSENLGVDMPLMAGVGPLSGKGPRLSWLPGRGLPFTNVLKNDKNGHRHDQASKISKSSCDGCWIAKSWITCVNTNGNTTLSEAQGVSLRITSGVRFRRRLPAKGVGLRVADSHTGNHPEDDFTPLETIRRPYSVIRKRILFELEGETFEPERGDSIATQTCELSKEEFNDFLTLYPIPSEYHVILPKSNQTVFDAPPGYVGMYTHSFSFANLRLPLTEFFCEVLEYFQSRSRVLCKVTTVVRVLSYDVDKYLHTPTAESTSSSSTPLTPEELKVERLFSHGSSSLFPTLFELGQTYGKDTFPDLKTVRSLLIVQEMRLKSRTSTLLEDYSSPMGNYRFGATCRYLHDANARIIGDTGEVNKNRGNNDTNELLAKLLAQLGEFRGSDVLRRLVSNNVISCNKEKPPVLCHACQLGKHVRLPFVSSNTIISSCFDIVHSDVWTSPIPSLSGFQYYVLFLDHYSQFVWVYPLVRKSDVLSKFILFRNYVRTQFKCEIRAFQCDHGGEFDNRNLHDLFNTHGIQFRFSCPKTSQQNGKSERMVRTLNNIIRTLLFQAKLPPTYWVEALHMAVHILNILPSTAINNEVPFTRLFGTSPDYSLLRHASNHRGYRCLDLTTNKIIISRHVTFDETVFPPVVKPRTIRKVLSLAASRHWPVHQLDVKNAFLHGDLSEIVYMHQPPGFWDSTHPDYVVGFHHSRCDNSLFIFHQGKDTAYLLLYVDDIALTTSSSYLLHRIIRSLHQEFAMTDLGSLNYFLGISVTRDSSGMFLSQKKYAVEILERAGMVHCNPSRTPFDTESKLGITGDVVSDPTLYRSPAGSLQYLTFTRPDISYAVQQVCLHMHDPREPHFSALKRILRYVSHVGFMGLQLFSSFYLPRTCGFSYADWLVFPTTKTIDIEVNCAVLATIYSPGLLSVNRRFLVPSARQSNVVFANRTKHIEIDIHFVRDLVAAGQVRVLHVPSRYQFADIFTKGLPTALFEEFRFSLSVRCPPAQTAGEY